MGAALAFVGAAADFVGAAADFVGAALEFVGAAPRARFVGEPQAPSRAGLGS